MKYFEKIKGDRIYLSPMNSDDYEIYTKWMNDKSVTENLSMHTQIVTLNSEKQWLEKNNNEYTFSIILKEEDRLLGNVSLMEVDLINGKAVLGIFIGEKDDRNKGYGKEAIKLILNYGFNSLNLNNIMLQVYSFNEKAINTYKKIGFKTFGIRRSCKYHDGVIYDEVYMDIVKEEFNLIEEFIFVP